MASPATTKTLNIGCWTEKELIEALALIACVEGSWDSGPLELEELIEYSTTLGVEWEGTLDEDVEGALGRAYQAFQPLEPYGKPHLEYKEKTKILPS